MAITISNEVKEAAKEALRVVVLALISWGIAKLTTVPQTEGVIIGTIVLRVIDKWLHEKGIGVGGNGLTYF